MNEMSERNVILLPGLVHPAGDPAQGRCTIHRGRPAAGAALGGSGTT
jgi:hypothetical protein